MYEPFKIVVTGLGAVTSQGNSVEKIWEAICSGQSGIRRLKGFTPDTLPTEAGGEVFFDDIPAPPEEPTSLANALLIHVAEKALQESGLDAVTSRMKVGLHLATPSVLCKSVFENIRKSVLSALGNGKGFCLPEFAQSLRENMRSQKNHMLLFPLKYLASKYHLQGDFMNVAVACASGTQAIHGALNSLRRGKTDAVLAVAVSTSLDPYYLISMARLGALSQARDSADRVSRPFDGKRDGLVMAEGAAAMVLEHEKSARERGAKIYAAIGGIGVSSDGYHPTAPDPKGDGMVLAMKKALASAGCKPEDIDYINAHGTGTLLNDRLETMSIKRVFGQHAQRVLVSSTKSMTGHLFTVAGMLEAMISVLACHDDVVPPTINYEVPDPHCDLNYVTQGAVKSRVNRVLSNSFGFGGQNACLIVGKPVS